VTAVLLVVVVGLTVGQPGLCPCWLLRDVARIHPHLGGDPSQPHTHEYLSNWIDSAPVAAPPILLPTIALVLELALAVALWRSLVSHGVFSRGSSIPPPLRPPRAAPEIQ
jgi:hypothetical protein